MFDRFPHPPELEVCKRSFTSSEVIERLDTYVSERRRRRIAEVVARRTYTVVPVLEGVHDLGNVNAVMRSAEGLGYGAAHLVSLQGDAAEWAQGKDPGTTLGSGLRTAQRQSQGADKWLDLHVWHDPRTCAEHLRAAGYRVLATHLAADATPIAEVDFTEPTAIVLGNEAEGVSPEMLALADANCLIPIDGFIQSYNVSVAAALALYQARADRIGRLGHHGDLDAAQREILTAVYYLRGVRNAEALVLA